MLWQVVTKRVLARFGSFTPDFSSQLLAAHLLGEEMGPALKVASFEGTCS